MDLCLYYRFHDTLTFDSILASLTQENTDNRRGYRVFETLDQSRAGELPFRVAVFHKVTSPVEPAWLRFVGALAAADLTRGRNGLAHAALILIEYGGHRYAATYGSAYSLPKHLRLERRFGKVAVSNGKVENEVRHLKSNVTGPHGKQRLESRGRGGPTRDLESPKNAHMVAGIAAIVDLYEPHVAVGDVGIRTRAATCLDELEYTILQLEEWWNDGIEQDATLAGLDRIMPVRDRTLIEELDNQRMRDVWSNEVRKFSLCLETEALWESTSINYVVKRVSYNFHYPDERQILRELSQAFQNGTDPRSVRYSAELPAPRVPETGRLLDNLAYETTLPNHQDTFLFESGAWYATKSSWLRRVESEVTALYQESPAVLGGLQLPTYASGVSEDTYIDSMVTSLTSSRCMKLHPTRHPQFNLELCDVCWDGRVLFFIKRGSDNDACTNVVQQALQTATALADRDDSFLRWFAPLLARNGWQLDVQDRSQIVLCILLLTARVNPDPLTYTVRAKDALSNFLREVHSMNFTGALVIR